MNFDPTTPVLVLRSARHGGVGVVRSLGRLGVPVYVLDRDDNTPSFASRFCWGRFVWDLNPDKTAAKDSVRYLEKVSRKIGRRAILLPTTDYAARFIAEHAGILKPMFLFPDQGADLVRFLCSKQEMYCLARRNGVPTPETAYPRSRADVLRYIETAKFPVLLKGIDGKRLRDRAGQPMFIVRNEGELVRSFDVLEDLNRPNLMLQEYIPGGEQATWMFNGYFDAHSRCLAAFSGRKLRQNPTHTGPTCLGVCIHNQIVEETTRTFLRKLAYRGIVDVDYRYDERDGAYKILDVNPRLGASFRLFVDDNGMDVVRAMYLDLTGQTVETHPAPEGRKWMVENADLVSAFRYLRDGNLTFKAWTDSLRGVQEIAYWASDDPGPLVRAFTNNLTDVIRHLFRRVTLANSGASPARRSMPGVACEVARRWPWTRQA